MSDWRNNVAEASGQVSVPIELELAAAFDTGPSISLINFLYLLPITLVALFGSFFCPHTHSPGVAVTL